MNFISGLFSLIFFFGGFFFVCQFALQSCFFFSLCLYEWTLFSMRAFHLFITILMCLYQLLLDTAKVMQCPMCETLCFFFTNVFFFFTSTVWMLFHTKLVHMLFWLSLLFHSLVDGFREAILFSTLCVLCAPSSRAMFTQQLKASSFF